MPLVSVVLAAHNEEGCIEEKIHNLMSLDYPGEQLEVVVVDDASTDQTVSRIQAAQSAYPNRRMVLVSLPEASGKTVALNAGVLRTQGEFLLFCDARQRIDVGAARALVAVFADETVGAASGELYLEGDQGPGLYWRYERAIRYAESQRDSVIGATGALYMVRRSLFQSFPAGLILDDVWMPMQIAMHGYRVLFVPEAKVFDKEAAIDREFHRKTRTLAGNFQLIAAMPQLLSPWHNRLFWSFYSHKVMRLICPYALVCLFLSNMFLLLEADPGFVWWLNMGGQVGFYSVAVLEPMLPGRFAKLSRIVRTFVVLNWAAVVGFKRFLLGDFRWTR